MPAVTVSNALDYPEEESSLGHSADDSAPSRYEKKIFRFFKKLEMFKGQLISQGLFGNPQFFQKTNEKI